MTSRQILILSFEIVFIQEPLNEQGINQLCSFDHPHATLKTVFSVIDNKCQLQY
jgi:hypothetical protein